MINVEKKSEPYCDCKGAQAGKAKDVIVITIETCCKKSCNKNGKKDAKQLEDSEDRTPPTPPPSEAGDTSQSELPPEPEPEPEPEPVVEEPQQKVVKEQIYKLPILIDRFHGPGCAMEINVMEKHENTCMYKKEPGEGRTEDDRVGSYECIGRLVFRTCNPNELESDSSGVAGGINPTNFTKTESIPTNPTPQSSPAIFGEKAEEGSEEEFRSVKGSVAPEGSIVAEKQEPVEASYYRMYKSDQMKISATRILKPPSRNSFLPPSRMNIFATKKKMPLYTDESNQTNLDDSTNRKNRASLETITSFSDLSRPKAKTKPSFFKTLFGRRSLKSGDSEEMKRFLRANQNKKFN